MILVINSVHSVKRNAIPSTKSWDGMGFVDHHHVVAICIKVVRVKGVVADQPAVPDTTEINPTKSAQCKL